MGLLLKIALLAIAVYGAWKTFRHWKGLFDRFTGKPDLPPRPPAASPPPSAPPASLRKVVVEDTVQCAGCGAYISTAAEKCGQCSRPRP